MSHAFNAQQLEAITTEAPMVCVVAAPGAGKTATMVERIERRVAAGADPARIAVMTFTVAGARELTERLYPINLGYTGTIHGFCFRLLQKHGALIGYRPGFISIIQPEEHEAMEKATASKLGVKPGKATKESKLIHDEVKAQLRRNNAVTYDGILQESGKLLVGYGVVSGIEELFVDESQDSSLEDWAIYYAIRATKMFVVGDGDQCHPAGVMVEIAKGDCVPIERLKTGDVIRGWDRNAGKMIGGRKIEVSKRPYDGELLEIKVGEKILPVTPNHKFLARWSDRTHNMCVTYLMYKKGLGFRVGWCQLFQHHAAASSHGLHFSVRCRLESADKGWILSVHNDRQSASIQESIIAAKYGLPLVTFREINGSTHYTQDALERVFKALEDENETRGIKCLESFGRLFDHSMYMAGQRRTRGTYMMTTASNLIPELMSLPLPEGINYWGQITAINRTRFKGDVYSLNVESLDRLYAANGIITHNSIFSFRGASPASLEAFARNSTMIKLETNYRSDISICSAATRLIRHNTGRIEKDVIPREGAEEGSIGVITAECDRDELACIRGAMFGIDFSDLSEVAILTRTNAHAQQIRDYLTGCGIPVASTLQRELPSDWPRVLAALNVLLDPDNDLHVERLLRVSGSGESVIGVLKSRALKRGDSLMHETIYPSTFHGEKTVFIFSGIMWALDISEESKDIVIERAELHPSGTLSDLALDLANPDRWDDAPESEGLTICTAHKSKGQEFDCVIVAGCEEEAWIKAKDTEEEIQEARRLAFVAITRARHCLILTSASSRQNRFTKRMEERTPVRFLKEMGI